MLPDEITKQLDAERTERRKHMARIYAISARYAPDIEPTSMFPLIEDWTDVTDIPGAQSRCIYHDPVSNIHLIKTRERGVLREHRHKDYGQYIQVLTGLVKARSGERVSILRRADWLWIDANTSHRMSWTDGTEVLVSFLKQHG